MTITEREMVLFLAAVRMAAGTAETRCRTASAILHPEHQFGIERSGHQPRKARPGIAETVPAQKASVHQWLIDEIPAMRMRGIESSEFGKVRARLNLEIQRKRERFEERLL